MDLETRVRYLKTALGLGDVIVSTDIAELTVLLMDKLEEKGGETNLEDVAKIRAYVYKKYVEEKPKKKKKKKKDE